MKVRAKLYGTLRDRLTGDRHSQGIEVELPDGATAQDLLAVLEIPEAWGAVVVMEGRILKPDDKMENGAGVNVFQAIHGG
jgi:sulfur carrier protein ThiS